jgi:hypothetical protein
MPSVDLQPIRDALAKATPGPWRTGREPGAHCRIYAPDEGHAIARTYGPELTGGHQGNGIGICSLTGPMNAADARLIASAPTWLADLVARVDRLQGLLAAIGKEADGWCHSEECDDFDDNEDGDAVCVCGKGRLERLTGEASHA